MEYGRVQQILDRTHGDPKLAHSLFVQPPLSDFLANRSYLVRLKSNAESLSTHQLPRNIIRDKSKKCWSNFVQTQL